MVQHTDSVGDVVECLDEVAEDKRKVCVGDAIEAFGYRSYGPLLLVPALLELTPFGAIPAVPTAIALVIAIFATQIAIGRKTMWLPAKLRGLTFSSERLDKATEKISPWAKKIDKWFHRRYPELTDQLGMRIAAVCCLLLCLTVPPLELLPLASSAPMAAIATFGLAITVRDGLLMIAGYVMTAVALVLGTYLAFYAG
jgi:hypothetical protein